MKSFVVTLIDTADQPFNIEVFIQRIDRETWKWLGREGEEGYLISIPFWCFSFYQSDRPNPEVESLRDELDNRFYYEHVDPVLSAIEKSLKEGD